MRHRICNHQPIQLTPIQRVNRIPAENRMCHDSNGGLRAMLNDHVGGFAERAARVGHVVDYDGNAVAHVADEDHAGDFVGASALFVDEGEGEVETIGYGCRSAVVDVGLV